MCLVCRRALKSCVHVYNWCESIRDLYFPLSLTTPPVKRLKPQCLYILSEKAGFGGPWEIADTNLAASRSRWCASTRGGRGGRVFCFPCPVL